MARAKKDVSVEEANAAPAAAKTAKAKAKVSAITTPEDIADIYLQYKQDCMLNDRRLTFEGFILRCGVTKETMLQWLESEDKALVEAIKKVQLDMTDDIQQRSDSMSIFRLKQSCYGGYNDKLSSDASGGLTVQFIISGVDVK